MATVKYYNSSTSQWEPILYGAQGDTGATGATGATNSLSIGTVTNGLTAGASITGSAPSQTLNLVLPLNANAIDADSIQILTNKTLVSPAFTGTPIAPTASAGTNTTQVATTAYVDAAVSNIIDTAPATLNTLNELAAAINDDASFASTVTTALGTKANLVSPTFTTPNIGVATGTSFNSITGLSSTTPNALGSAAVGTGTTTARADHVHPTTGLGLTANGLNQFAATTSSQLAGVISDETGSGALVFATSPTLVTPALGNATATTINASGSLLWEAASAGSIASRIKTGVYENSAPTVAGGWPETSGWHHLISATHSSTGNYYAAQFTSDFFNSENLWYRSVNGGGALWNRVLQSTIQRAEKTSAYTLVAQDVGRLIEINMAGANTLTVPTNTSVPFPVGAQINILQTAGGQVTVGGAGVTINATPGLKLRTQWSSATLIKRATNTWVLVGDLSA
jgi:hypothetical protein